MYEEFIVKRKNPIYDPDKFTEFCKSAGAQQIFDHIGRIVDEYRKPPNISPGLIFVRKHFLVGLYMRGLYTGGLIYGQDFVLVILTIY